MPMKKLTLKEIRELGIPIHRSYIRFHQKPLPNQKLKKLSTNTHTDLRDDFLFLVFSQILLF